MEVTQPLEIEEKSAIIDAITKQADKMKIMWVPEKVGVKKGNKKIRLMIERAEDSFALGSFVDGLKKK